MMEKIKQNFWLQNVSTFYGNMCIFCRHIYITSIDTYGSRGKAEGKEGHQGERSERRERRGEEFKVTLTRKSVGVRVSVRSSCRGHC